MPKLGSQKATEVEEAEGSFSPLDPGVYEIQLEEVEVREGPKGPYWNWTFKIPEGQKRAGKNLWLSTSLSASALWKLKEVFDAFEVPTTTDTDDLVGRRVKAELGIRTIQGGQREGQLDNEITRVLPLSMVTVPNGTSDKTPSKTKKADDVPF